jgi:3-dehydroquinate dehydratase
MSDHLFAALRSFQQLMKMVHHLTHNFETNYSRSKLESVGHRVSKHHFNVVQIALTPISETLILATICATGSLVET